MPEDRPDAERSPRDVAAEHIKANRFAEAERILSALFARDDTDASALWMRGLANFGLARFDDAIADFNRSAKLAPHEPAPHYYAAMAHYRAGRRAGADAACWAALAIDGNYTPAHNLLAGMEMPGESYVRVLERIHAHLKPRTYIEIGVADGESVRLTRPETLAIGVDPEPRIRFPLGPNVKVVAETSDRFFASYDARVELDGQPVALAFIDGMHHFEFALRDFMHLEALAAPGATIMLHDVYPLDARTAARQRTTEFWTGDVWRLVLLLREHRPDLWVHTIATVPSGLALVRNLDPGSTFIRDNFDWLVARFMAVDYAVLEGRKAERLALFQNDWPRIRDLLDWPVSPRGA